jgi:hypothetical protein
MDGCYCRRPFRPAIIYLLQRPLLGLYINDYCMCMLLLLLLLLLLLPSR